MISKLCVATWKDGRRPILDLQGRGLAYYGLQVKAGSLYFSVNKVLLKPSFMYCLWLLLSHSVAQ